MSDGRPGLASARRRASARASSSRPSCSSARILSVGVPVASSTTFSRYGLASAASPNRIPGERCRPDVGLRRVRPSCDDLVVPFQRPGPVPADLGGHRLHEPPLLRRDAIGMAQRGLHVGLERGAIAVLVRDGELDVGEREVRIGRDGAPVRLDRLLPPPLSREPLPLQPGLPGLGLRGDHLGQAHGRGSLRGILLQRAPDPVGHPVERVGDSRRSAGLLADGEQGAIPGCVDATGLDLQPGGDGAGLQRQRHVRLGLAGGAQRARRVDAGRGLRAGRRGPGCDERVREQRNPRRLLERRGEQAGDLVERRVSGEVRRVGQGHGEAPGRQRRRARPQDRRDRGDHGDQRQGLGDPEPPLRLARLPERGERRVGLRPVRHPLGRIPRQHPPQDLHERRGGPRDLRRRAARRHPSLRPCLVGKLPGEELEEDDAQRVDVGPLVDRLAARLLRRHEGGRAPAAPRLAAQEVGEPEVEDLHPTVLAEKGVGGLEVAVQDTVLVGVGEAAGHVVGHPERLVERQHALLEARRQRLPAQELHDEVWPGGAAAHVEERDDVRVVELRDRLGLLLDPLGGELASGTVGAQGLERHAASQLRVDGLVHQSEATPSNLAADLEASDPGSGPELLLPGGHDVVGRGQRDLLEQPRERAGIVRAGRPIVASLFGLVGHVGASGPLLVVKPSNDRW